MGRVIRKQRKKSWITIISKEATLSIRRLPISSNLHYFSVKTDVTEYSANNYQDEESEKWVGKWMQKRDNRDSNVLATKYSCSFRALGGKETLANTASNGTKSLHVPI